MTFPKDERRGRRDEFSMLSARDEVLIHVKPRAARSTLLRPVGAVAIREYTMCAHELRQYVPADCDEIIAVFR